MTLTETDSRLFNPCRMVEKATAGVIELNDSAIEVTVEPNFDMLVETSNHVVSHNDPSAYQISKNTIFVNGIHFFNFSSEIQAATLAHEVGHHLCNVAKHPERKLGISEDIFADWLVCGWGFFEALKKSREDRFGEEYATLLEHWKEKETFFDKMKEWRKTRN